MASAAAAAAADVGGGGAKTKLQHRPTSFEGWPSEAVGGGSADDVDIIMGSATSIVWGTTVRYMRESSIAGLSHAAKSKSFARTAYWY